MRVLMQRGENVLVFPGGSREVNKRRGEKYRLIWKERVGFARLAIEHGFPIVPFASVGGEEMLEIVLDDSAPVLRQVAGLLDRLAGLPLPPLVRGVGPTMIPRPERLYFWFGEPIETVGATDPRAVRDEVRTAVEGGIEFLPAERKAHPDRGFARRLLEGAG